MYFIPHGIYNLFIFQIYEAEKQCCHMEWPHCFCLILWPTDSQTFEQLLSFLCFSNDISRKQKWRVSQSQIIIPSTCFVYKPLDTNYCEAVLNCMCKFWSCALSSTALTLLLLFMKSIKIFFFFKNLLVVQVHFSTLSPSPPPNPSHPHLPPLIPTPLVLSMCPL